MPVLPYPPASRWAVLMILLILGINLAVLAYMQDLIFPSREAGDNAWTVALFYALNPPPFMLWFRGDGLPEWGDAIRLLTHGYVHGGWAHLAFNMVSFVPLAWLTARRVGTFGMVALYHLLIVLAALAFTFALELTIQGYIYAGNWAAPTAGASGGVHGLGGLWLVWAYKDRLGGFARRIWPSLLWACVILGGNVWIWIWRDGEFAWALHIAGIAIGMVLALLIPARNR